MRYSRRAFEASRLGFLLALLAFPLSTPAHRLDEYLQATLVSIEPSGIRLQINLTPGVEVADHVLPLIDHDGNGRISTNEANTYSELLKRDLVVRLDGHKVSLKCTASNFPDLTELQTGWGVIQLEFSVIGPLPAGVHKLSIKNKHLPALSVYLCNAAQPKSVQVHITKQKRNKTQSTGEIEFTIDPHGFVRSQAATALGKFGTNAKPAFSALVELLHDENQDVRNAAAAALRAIDNEAAKAAINDVGTRLDRHTVPQQVKPSCIAPTGEA